MPGVRKDYGFAAAVDCLRVLALDRQGIQGPQAFTDKGQARPATEAVTAAPGPGPKARPSACPRPAG